MANVPVPFEVQTISVWLLALEPVVILTAPELEQVLTAVPATAVGAAVTETVTETECELHFSFNYATPNGILNNDIRLELGTGIVNFINNRKSTFYM